MKQIEEMDNSMANKLYYTPKKKEKLIVKQSQCKGNQGQGQLNQLHEKFDLGSSPRFKRSTQINVRGQSSGKVGASISSKKPYSPIIVKGEQSQFSTSKRIRKIKSRKKAIFSQYGDMKVQANFKKCYQDYMNKVKQNYEVEIPLPQIIQTQNNDEVIFSQLITFILNPKNSRNLRFNQENFTMFPIFQCLGCQINFDKASALGGHLSRCPEKNVHYKKLKQHYVNRSVINQEYQQSQDQLVKLNQIVPYKNSESGGKEVQSKAKQNHFFFSSSDSNSGLKKSICGSVRSQNDNQDFQGKLDEGSLKNPKIVFKTQPKIVKKATLPNKFVDRKKNYPKHK